MKASGEQKYVLIRDLADYLHYQYPNLKRVLRLRGVKCLRVLDRRIENPNQIASAISIEDARVFVKHERERTPSMLKPEELASTLEGK